MVVGVDMFVATVIGAMLLALIAHRWPAPALALWVTASAVLNKYLFSQDMSIYHIHPSHLLLAGLLLGYLSRGPLQLQSTLTGVFPELLMIALVGWAITTGFMSGNLFRDDVIRTIGELINGFLIPTLLLYLAHSTPQSMRSRWRACNILILLLAYLAFTAFCEHFKADWLVFPKYILDPTLGLHPERARGPVTNAAENGGIIAILIVIALHRISYVSTRVIRYSGTVLLLIAGLPALWFTETRGPWVAFVGGLLVMLWHKRAKRPVLAIGAFIVLSLVAFHFAKENLTAQRTDTTDTTEFRLTLYRESLAAFEEHPIFGWGLGTFTSKDRPAYGAGQWQILGHGDVQHDTTVAIATENGIVGVILFVALFALLFRRLLQRKRLTHSVERRDFCTVCVAVLAILLINGVFADFRDWMTQNAIVFLIAGLGLAVPLENASRSILLSPHQELLAHNRNSSLSFR